MQGTFSQGKRTCCQSINGIVVAKYFGRQCEGNQSVKSAQQGYCSKDDGRGKT